jgi:hypothetical protein
MTTFFIPQLALDGTGPGEARPRTARFPAQLSRQDGWVSFLPRRARKAT